jgi:hypothetical protein
MTWTPSYLAIASDQRGSRWLLQAIATDQGTADPLVPTIRLRATSICHEKQSAWHSPANEEMGQSG